MATNDVPLPLYRASGDIRFLLIPGVVIGGIVAVVLGFLYGVLSALNPFVIVSVALMFGFSFLVGTTALSTSHYSHCRNRFVALALAVGFATVALAASYWIQYRFDSRATVRSADGAPLGSIRFSDWLGVRKEAGWVIRGAQMNGPYVTTVWGFEAFSPFQLRC